EMAGARGKRRIQGLQLTRRTRIPSIPGPQSSYFYAAFLLPMPTLLLTFAYNISTRVARSQKPGRRSRTDHANPRNSFGEGTHFVLLCRRMERPPFFGRPPKIDGLAHSPRAPNNR